MIWGQQATGPAPQPENQMARIIRFGYDKDPQAWQRGYAREDWSLMALEDSRGFGWQVVDLRGNRSCHMRLADAIAYLEAV